MGHDIESVEAARRRYRPERITTLFIGESAPFGGNFFYYGNNALLSHMQRAVDTVLGTSINSNFLESFKAYGWYLDDLVLTPVDKLPAAERKVQCRAAQPLLAARIAEYQPLAIVSLLLSIKDDVEAASITAGSNAPRYAVCFPLMGGAKRFREDMARILPILPRLE